MDILDRVKKICLSPRTEWPVIAGETTAAGTLITGYVLPLAAVSAAAGFIGGSLIGRSLPFVGTFRVPIVTGLGMAVFMVVMAVVGVFIVSLLINALAPTFGARKDSAQALKVAAYAFTPSWVAGVFQVLPALGLLAVLGGLYGIYLLYLGLPALMNGPEDKAVGYTAVVVLCAVVVMMVLGAMGSAVFGAGMMGAMRMGGGGGGSEVEFDPDSALGRLQQLGQQMERSASQMEEAQQSGDPNRQAAAAMEGLGALLGGGRRVEPIQVDELKAFVPGTFAGMPMTDSSAERSGIAALMIARADATYGDGSGREVRLEIVDSGGVSGLMGLASWVGVQGEREDSTGTERTRQESGRLVHERTSRTGGDNEFGVVIGERFMVGAKSASLGVNELRAAVSSLDLARLESLKDQGAQR